MSGEIPDNLRYAETHEWVRNDDGIFVVGITDHAQEALGDLVFVDLPEAGREVSAKEECAAIDSVKAASDIYSPVAGKIIEVNTALADEPEIISSSPYENGWLFKLEPEDVSSFDSLLTAEQYKRKLEEDA